MLDNRLSVCAGPAGGVKTRDAHFGAEHRSSITDAETSGSQRRGGRFLTFALRAARSGRQFLTLARQAVGNGQIGGFLVICPPRGPYTAGVAVAAATTGWSRPALIRAKRDVGRIRLAQLGEG